MKPVSDLIAEQLKVPVARVRDDLAFGAIPEWDSLNHVNLMLELERVYGIPIGDEEMVDLISVRAIRQFLGGRAPVDSRPA
jgi:citrate synthase